MRHVSVRARIGTLALALAVLGTPGVAGHGTVVHPAHRAGKQTCAVLGKYNVGPRILPLAKSGRHAGTPPAGGTAIAWPAWILRGTLVITAYSGCGHPTAGTFAVRQTTVGPPLEAPQKGTTHAGILCANPCWQPPYGIAGATGSFVQDPAHPADPVYLSVSATTTTTRPGPQMGRPCSVQTGCPPAVVITSTTTISSVTGYLQVPAYGAAASPPVPARGSQTVTLSFLPPPTLNSYQTPAAMVLQGWRGQQPLPLPAPLPGVISR